MTMIENLDVSEWYDRNLVGPDNSKIGKITDIYLDNDTDQPEWAAVQTGLFGNRVSFVPLAGASRAGDDLMVPYDKAMVKDAPNVEADGALSPEEEAQLYQHYGLSYSQSDSASGLPAGGPTAPSGSGQDVSGPNTDDAMTRSEEELQVGKISEEAGRVRLRKYIVTENVQTTVPVQREEAVIEREPITDANRGPAMSGAELSEEEHEMTLNEEQVVVDKQVVPKERVRVDKATVTEDQQISEELRKEQIDMEQK
jgi:uncharacterized protein (TIGR02271 family)